MHHFVHHGYSSVRVWAANSHSKYAPYIEDLNLSGNVKRASHDRHPPCTKIILFSSLPAISQSSFLVAIWRNPSTKPLPILIGFESFGGCRASPNEKGLNDQCRYLQPFYVYRTRVLGLQILHRQTKSSDTGNRTPSC
ncbi:hypothetical protein M378DRAFT_673520, partial [Amanita muscaria Koide BX008]